MKRFTLLLLFLIMPHLARAQVSLSAAGTDCTISNACLTVAVGANTGGVTFSITSNTSGNTIQFEAAADGINGAPPTLWVALNVTPSNGTTAVTSTTSTGVWQANVSAYTNVRMRMSTLAGSTTTVLIRQSTASARSNGGGGSVTHTAGNLTAFHLMLGNGLADSTVDSACLTNGTGALSGCTTIKATTSVQAVGAAAQAMNLYVSGGCDGISACTGNFWGLQAPASLAASLQYTPPIVDGLAGDGLTTDGSQHMAWAIQRRTLTGTAYTNATTTFSNVVGSAGQTLQFTVAASANYKIACDIEWQGSANTTGPKWQWTGPASPTALVQYAHNPVTTSTYLDAVGSKTAFSSPMADTGTITTATDFVSHLDLELVNGVNAGTVVLQAAANGVGTLTIQPGSSCVSNGDK